MSDFTSFDPLLSGYFEGSITRDELIRLEEKLLADEEFARYVARWCMMHRQIGDLVTEKLLHQLMDQFATRSPALRQEIFNRPAAAASAGQGGIRTTVGQIRSHPLRSALYVAAALVIAALSIAWWQHRTGQPDMSATTPMPSTGPAGTPQQRLATLTQLIDAVWMKDAPQFHHGEPLMRGSTIALQSGMAKITFDCGAEIVLEGPCYFVAREPMVGYLKFGKITADVPRRAFAFAILSPKVDFVDLGTSFGLNISDQGHTELHVFRGEVLCSRLDPEENARGTVYHVHANNAVEFRGAKGGPSDIAMDEQKFSDHFIMRRGTKARTGPLPGSNLALWLAADSGVTTDAQQRVISWQDILYGDNQSGEDAIQVDESARPKLVADALAGLPAIRFDGNDCLLTTPLATTDDQTVAFVCQYSPSAADKSRRWGGQILNYDGPPSRYLSDTLEPGVLQIGEPLLEQEFKPTLLTAQVFAGFIGSATVESGRVDAKPVGINSPVVVTYCYDLTNARATLAINGKPFSETRAFAPQAITSRKIIGRHAWMQNFFRGDLAELMIFNKALTPGELDQTTRYLADKYSVKLEGSNSDRPTQTTP